MVMNLPKVERASDGETKEVVPDYLYEKKEIATVIANNPTQRVWGVPAAALTWGIDGLRHTEVLTVGKEGEKATNKILTTITEQNPNVYVFNSLRWPTSNGDTDHILLYKGLGIVIDTKRWKGTRKYSVTPKGSILRGTVAFSEGRVKIGYALKAWRKKIPTLKIHGVVTIAQEKVFVVRDRNWYKAPFRLVEHEKLETFIHEQIKQYDEDVAKGKVQPITSQEQQFLLYTMLSYLVKPYDPRKGLIRGSTANPFKK